MGRACHGPSQMDAASLVSGGFATLRIDRFRLHRGFYARSPTHHRLHSATPTCPTLADSPVPLPRHAYPTPRSSWLLCCAPFPRVVVSWAVSDGCGISRQRRRRDASHRQVSASSRFLRALTYASPPAFRHTDMPYPCRLASATSAPCLSHSSVILVALLRSLPARRGVMGRLRWMRRLSSAAASRRFASTGFGFIEVSTRAHLRITACIPPHRHALPLPTRQCHFRAMPIPLLGHLGCSAALPSRASWCHGPSQMDAASLVSGGVATLRIDRFRLHRGFY